MTGSLVGRDEPARRCAGHGRRVRCLVVDEAHLGARAQDLDQRPSDRAPLLVAQQQEVAARHLDDQRAAFTPTSSQDRNWARSIGFVQIFVAEGRPASP